MPRPTPPAAPRLFSPAMIWGTVAILSLTGAGAAVGNEAARYFWDLAVYVESLDSEFPYRFETPYPFLYPPFALDLFTLARSHLFELFSIAYVAAVVLFLRTFARLDIPRRFEWLLAITSMGGLGVVSLLSGNVGIPMNLTVLAVALEAAMGHSTAGRLLPIVIGLGALIKPQFALYLGLLLCLDPSVKAAVVKAAAVGSGVVGVHATYAWLRPHDWNEYVQAVIKRTTIEHDYGWGPAGLMMPFSDTNATALVAYVAAVLLAGLMSYATWQKTVRGGGRMPPVAAVSLVFVVATFANPRLPLYDLFAAGIAVIVCCGLADRASSVPATLVLALAINLVPWLIANFARTPSAYPWWTQHLVITHLLGIGALLLALSRTGVRPAAGELDA